jgi:selenide,water dikinase
VNTTSSDPALLVGLEAPDDAAVYRVGPDLAIVQTVDFFTPVVDDPFAWGRIAAVNSLSDIYAMGARPVTALNLVGWPRSLDFELLGRVLEGAGEACDEAGVAVVGGHSVDDPEPKFGLSVTGLVDPQRLVRKTGGRAGDALVLTKPLGMGIVSSGIKEGKASEEAIRRATTIMATLNREAAEAMVAAGATAATDVTGFGLVGHLLQMLDGVSARLELSLIPVLEEAFALARAGVIPGGSRRNAEAHQRSVDAEALDDAQRAVLFDAQTSGGLLIAISQDKVNHLLEELDERQVEDAAVIGSLVAGNGRIEVTG